jgi:1-acyl-sn-glycerol-3-phosphate acyltransferase|tara:strand:- start:9680 stop:10381 length:702 start_codon:yes stop_codon:yes gene_type:complete
MIRGIIFKFFFYIGTISICIIFLPALILPKKFILIGGKILGHWIKFCLYFFLSVKIEVKGLKNIPKNSNFFIASLHQSIFETFFLQAIFNYPVFILKKELLRIPIFGWHLKKAGSISIDRDKISKENLGFYDKIISVTTNTKRPVIIFPQATRTPIDDKQSFKKGVSKIYEKLNFICVPVALNSGIVWPKSGKLNSNKTITVSILENIPAGLNSNDFLKKLEYDLYSELEKIC